MIRLKTYIEELTETLISVIRILSKSKFSISLKELKIDKNDIAVLGNGPSLKDSLDHDMDFIKDKVKLVVNTFAVSDVYEILKPEYYVLADQQFWMKDQLQRAKDIVNSTLDAIINKTNWELNLLLPYEAKNSGMVKMLIESNSNIKINYYNKVRISGFKKFRRYCFDRNLGIPRPQNVLIPSLMIALNIGYKNIYLFGADHTWHENLALDKDNNLCFRDPHFYNEETKLHPIKNIHTGEPVRLHEQFYSLYITFRSYWVIRLYTDEIGVKIYNASIKSFIDAFERVNINNI